MFEYNQIDKDRPIPYVGPENIQLLENVANVTNTTVEYLLYIEKTIIVASLPKTHSEVMSFLSTETQIDGPHAFTILEIQGGGDYKEKLVGLLFGEVHQNPDGCRNKQTLTMFAIMSELLMTSKNLYLILESFFHLLINSVNMALRVSQELQKRKQNEHSMWVACGCIANLKKEEKCRIGNKKVGQLILFRAFAFIIQVTVAFLNEANIKESAFHHLAHRIRFMDLREDLDLRPYEWLDGGNETEKLRSAQSLLQNAYSNIEKFIPTLKYEDLKAAYQANVKKVIMGAIDDFISSPSSKNLYDFIFTTITELVTIAQYLHIMENHHHCHILVVVGDKHRELILQYLRQIFKGKILSDNTYTGGDRTSCVPTKLS
jgi:hypothetical protein